MIPAVTERDFLRQVLKLARILGWNRYHPSLSIWSERGWPDLALVRPPHPVLAELKRENGKTTPEQPRNRTIGGVPRVMLCEAPNEYRV